MSKTIGLALGGGSARGWAHVGVLRALEEHNIPINYIAGTSIGALVGAIYVNDKLHRLEHLADDISAENLVSFMDISFPGLGLIDGKRVREFLAGYLGDTMLEECSIPFRCVATNFLRKEEVVFASGSMVDAVRASISMPGVFVPYRHEKAYLVDGGVVNPVPVSVVQAMGADVVIAVNLNRDPETIDSSAKPERDARQTSQASSSTNQDDTHQRQPPSSADQPDAGFAQGLMDRYENLKDVLQEQIDDWMPDPETGMNIFDVIGNSINMMEQQVTRVRLQTDIPQVLIEPDLMQFGLFDFQQAQPMMQQGYAATKAMMPKIEELVEQTEAAG